MAEPVATPAAEEPLRLDSPRGRWVLAGTVLGSGMAMLDGTVVNVALPRLGEDLGAELSGLQWVVNGYMLALASLILVGGSLGDRWGRRRVFTTGVVWFTVSSVACGAAPTVGVLVAARVLQGIGAALLTPGSLAIIQASFHRDDRARAIGAWSGLGGVTAAIGPFLGGWLVGAVSWRLVFLLNVPLAAVVVFVAVRHIPESKADDVDGPLDLPGAVLGAAGLALLTYGLIERRPVLMAGGAVALLGFLLVEARSRHAMLPLGVFQDRTFSATNAVTFVLYAALGLVLFLLSLVLQEALGFSPLAAGLATLPLTLVMLAFSARAGALAQRIGPRLPLVLGPTAMAAGLLLLTRVEPGRPYVSTVLPALLVFAGGLALTVAPLTATVLASAGEGHTGVASGVNNAVARVGSLLAVAAIPFIAGFAAGEQVTPAVLVDGFHRAMLVAAAMALVAAALAGIAVRNEALRPEPAKGSAEPCFSCDVTALPLGAFGSEGAEGATH